MSNRPSKLDDLIYFSVTSSSSSNSNHNNNAFSGVDDGGGGGGAMPDERNFLRPGTARSLPTPYTTHAAVDPASGADDDGDKTSLMSSRYLNVSSSDYNGNRPRNLSYPSLNSLPPTPNPSPVRVINVVSSSSTTTSASGRSAMAFDDPELNNRVDNPSSHPPPPPHRNSSKQSSRKSSSRVPTPVPLSSPVNVSGGIGGESSMPVSPKNIVISGNGSASGKSNLDFFLDYSRNPFTTKYEIVGNSKGKLNCFFLCKMN